MDPREQALADAVNALAAHQPDGDGVCVIDGEVWTEDETCGAARFANRTIDAMKQRRRREHATG